MILIKTFYISILFFQFNLFADSLQITNVNQAIDLTLENNSELKAQKLRLEGVNALIEQANSLPNPALNLEIEDFSGDRNGFDETENTFSLSQKIELGGKRRARTALATSMTKLEEAKTKLKLANLIRDVEIAYSDVLLSQTKFQLTKEQEEFARSVLKTVKEKVEHGGILVSEQTKAEITLQIISIDSQKAKNNLEQKKRVLSSFWNGSLNDIAKLNSNKNSSITSELQIPPIESFLSLQVQSMQIEISKDNLTNEEAKVISDITFSGGYRRFEDTDTDAFIAGLSIPLPLFNKNQGRVSQASNEIEASKESYQQYATLLSNEVDLLMQTKEILLKERTAILKHLLPSSQKALKQIQEAYRLGRVGYLDLIDSQRAYFDTRMREAENLFALKSNKAKITANTGQILNSIKIKENNE